MPAPVTPPTDPAVTTAPPSPPPTPGPPVGRLVAGAVLVLVGVLWLLDALALLALAWEVVLPAVLALVGVALLATARRGAPGGLVGTGIALTVLVLIASATPLSGMTAGIGERDERPTSAAEAEEGYELGMGELRVDLSEVDDFADGATVGVSVGMGEVHVTLPDGVGAEVEASAGMGEVTVRDRAEGGIGVAMTEELAGQPTIVLEASVGLGDVEVTR